MRCEYCGGYGKVYFYVGTWESIMDSPKMQERPCHVCDGTGLENSDIEDVINEPLEEV